MTSLQKPSIVRLLNVDVLDLICASLHDLVKDDQQQKIRATIDPTVYKPRYDSEEPDSGDTSTSKVSLIPLSETCKRFRALCIPRIFQGFELSIYGDNIWIEASKRLNHWKVERSRWVREVVIRLSLSYSAHGYAPFDATLPDTLATILLQMSRVKKLTIDIDKSRVRLFEDAFKKHKAILPSIRRFALWRYRVGILDMCPNVTSIAVHSLSADHLKALMETLPGFSKLEAFYLDNTSYTEEVLDDLSRVIPKIRVLILSAGLSRAMSFQRFVAKLSQFREVEVVCVALAVSMGVGLRNPRCGNITQEQQGHWERKLQEANQRIALTIFSRCPSIKTLWLGSQDPVVATVHCSTDGSMEQSIEWDKPTHTWIEYF